MKALTLTHPWPLAILRLGKRVENRVWKPPLKMVGEDFAIHGGVTPSRYTMREAVMGRNFIDLMLRKAKPRIVVPPLGEMVVGHCGIVAVVRLVGVVTASDSPWFVGPYGWVLDDVRELTNPVPCKGMLGLWEVPPDVKDAVTAQVEYQETDEEARAYEGA